MKKGFTLIELLVVVLIVGILAAVALPQYQKAVAKTRIAALMPLMRPLQLAVERYYLDNNSYPTRFSDLDLDLSCTWRGPDDKTCNIGPVQINLALNYMAVSDSRVPRVALVYFATSMSCYAYDYDEDKTAFANDICKSLSGKTTHGTVNHANTYTVVSGKNSF